MECTNLAARSNPALNEWWKTALEVRSGGFDRLLGAAPGCPTIADLRRDGVTRLGVRARALGVPPGRGARLPRRGARGAGRRSLGDYGHTLVGLYEVLMTDTEVMTVWATDPAGHEALGRAIDAGRRRADRAVAHARRQYLTRWREELMTPYPGTLLSRGDPL